MPAFNVSGDWRRRQGYDIIRAMTIEKKQVMRIGFFVLAASIFQANAAPLTPPEFKGLPLGSSVAEFRQRFPDFECTSPSKNVVGDTACWLSPEIKCGTAYTARAVECRRKVEGAVTFGGIRVKQIAAYFYDSTGLGYVSVKIAPEHFESLLSLLVEKHGKPDAVDTEILRNRMGAEFENATASWTTGILASKYGKSLDEGVISMRLPVFSAEFNRRSAIQKEINKSDL